MNKLIENVRKNVSPWLDSFPDIQTTIEVGISDTKILKVALRDKVDFIIMGTQGENTVLDRFLGSTTADVLKFAECPVLIIPEKAKFREEIIFTKGATEAINLVASTYGKKYINKGDEILITELEHHSNYVPWHFIRSEKGAVIKFAPVNENGDVEIDERK